MQGEVDEVNRQVEDRKRLGKEREARIKLMKEFSILLGHGYQGWRSPCFELPPRCSLHPLSSD